MASDAWAGFPGTGAWPLVLRVDEALLRCIVFSRPATAMGHSRRFIHDQRWLLFP
jgi:hypothetical protein